MVSASEAPPPEPPLASGGWGLYSQTPALLLPPTIKTLSPSKNNKFCIFQILAAIFRFKLCRFCWQRAQKYFLPQHPRAQGTLAMPLFAVILFSLILLSLTAFWNYSSCSWSLGCDWRWFIHSNS